MADSPPGLSKVFISYSHRDKDFLDRLQEHLRPHVRAGTIPLWVDTNLKPGDDWEAEIKRALDAAQVAILLVSVSFLASDFVAEKELPKLLAAAESRGARILLVILTPCTLRHMKLGRFHTVNDPARPLSGLSQHEQDVIWVQVVDDVLEALEKATSQPQTQLAPTSPHAHENLPHPPAASPLRSEQPHQQRASETLNPIVESIPIQKPDTLPGHRTWWVVLACPKDGDVENLKTWHVVYASLNDTSTWDQILPDAQPHWEGAKAVKGLTRHAATKNMTVNRKLRTYFDALHWEHPFAVDWLKEFEDHGWRNPRGDLGKA